MTHRLISSAHRLALVGLLTLGSAVLGCSSSDPASTSPGDLEVPGEEPAAADAVDTDAAHQHQTALASTVASEQSSEWPQLFGPARTSVAPVQPVDLSWGTEGPAEVWSLEVGTGYGSPVVSADRVVFNHRVEDEEVIQCVRAADGSELWEHRYPTTFVCEQDYSDGPYSTPVIAGTRVYSVGGQGQVICLDLESGDVIWQRDLHKEYEMEDDIFPCGATPAIADGRMIFNLGAVDREAGIIALNAEDGSDLWQASAEPAAYCSPFVTTIHGQPFAFVYANRSLVSLHPETGEIDWAAKHYGRAPMSYNAVSPLVVNDKVLVVTGPGPGALCLQVNPDRTFTEAWKSRRVLDSQYNTLMPHGDAVIGFTAAGQGGAELRSIDMNTGKVNWRYHSLLKRGQGLVIGDALLILGERGHLAALVAGETEPQVLAFTDQPLMSEPCYCAPALAGSKLYLKDEQRLACFDLSVRN